jgi:hypothetical protein
MSPKARVRSARGEPSFLGSPIQIDSGPVRTTSAIVDRAFVSLGRRSMVHAGGPAEVMESLLANGVSEHTSSRNFATVGCVEPIRSPT